MNRSLFSISNHQCFSWCQADVFERTSSKGTNECKSNQPFLDLVAQSFSTTFCSIYFHLVHHQQYIFEYSKASIMKRIMDYSSTTEYSTEMCWKMLSLLLQLREGILVIAKSVSLFNFCSDISISYQKKLCIKRIVQSLKEKDNLKVIVFVIWMICNKTVWKRIKFIKGSNVC